MIENLVSSAVGFLGKAGIALLVLGIIIVIHELGHFLVAKFFKVKVETFSVGFGPRLLGFRYGETDYRISAFPLGGYVKMAGENPGDTVTGAANEFLSKPKWQRFLVAAAGPAMNIVLAVGLLTGLFMYGTEIPASAEGDAVVGAVEAGSPAQAAGIQTGDRIVSIDGKENPKWEHVMLRVLINGDHTIPVALKRNGQTIETSLTPVKKGRNDEGYAGMQPKHTATNIIGRLEPGHPAVNAGLQPDDEIISINGVNLKETGNTVPDAIQSVTAESFPITILRAGKTQEFTVTPILKDGRKVIGISAFRVETVMVKENFGEAFSRSIDQNVEYGTLIFKVLRRLVTRDISPKTVDGPLRIMQQTSEIWQYGIAATLQLMAMISLNLGLMNLLPIPILDGGVMLLLLIEGIMRQELSLAFKERIVQVSFVFLLTLMVFVLYNDVVKMLPTAAGP